MSSFFLPFISFVRSNSLLSFLHDHTIHLSVRIAMRREMRMSIACAAAAVQCNRSIDIDRFHHYNYRRFDRLVITSLTAGRVSASPDGDASADETVGCNELEMTGTESEPS